MSDIEAALSSADPRLGRVIEVVVARVGRQRIVPSCASPFEALARAVVYQSVSGKAAATIFTRVKQQLSGPFVPADILALPRASHRATGLSASQTEAIRNLAGWFEANPATAQVLSELSDEAVTETLTAIPGIGAWTVNVFLVFSLGRLDVMPASDLGLRRGVQLTYRLPRVATPGEVRARAELWRPYRSVASVYLWTAVKLKVGPGELT